MTPASDVTVLDAAEAPTGGHEETNDAADEGTLPYVEDGARRVTCAEMAYISREGAYPHVLR